ncbi:MAG: winged helix-turn-helix transcriptional regulator [Shimia sp.]
MPMPIEMPMPRSEPAPDGGPWNGPCPVETTLRTLSGKWTLFVLFTLAEGPMRFNALQRRLGAITQRVLTATLRRLEEDGLVWRRSAGTVPPRVEYGLTEKGEALAPVWGAMAHRGIRFGSGSGDLGA